MKRIDNPYVIRDALMVAAWVAAGVILLVIFLTEG